MQGLGDGLRPQWPVAPLFMIEALAKHDAGADGPEDRARRYIQAHDASRAVEDEQRVVHARENRLELTDSAGRIVRATVLAQFERGCDLRRHGLNQQQVILVIRSPSVALKREHADEAI